MQAPGLAAQWRGDLPHGALKGCSSIILLSFPDFAKGPVCLQELMPTGDGPSLSRAQRECEMSCLPPCIAWGIHQSDLKERMWLRGEGGCLTRVDENLMYRLGSEAKHLHLQR